MDITDRKRAEEALRRSEEEFHIIFEHSALGMVLVDSIWPPSTQQPGLSQHARVYGAGTFRPAHLRISRIPKM